MGNMGYCRFQNTLGDLRDCEDALQEGLDNLSEEEAEAAAKLIKMCRRIADDYAPTDDEEATP